MNRIEGYWRTKDNGCGYPMPLPNKLSQSEKEEIGRLILQKEQEAKVTQYRGPSWSRITGETLGSREFSHPHGWTWPSDFRPHYVEKHGVRPTQDFLDFIGYKTELKFIEEKVWNGYTKGQYTIKRSGERFHVIFQNFTGYVEITVNNKKFIMWGHDTKELTFWGIPVIKVNPYQ